MEIDTFGHVFDTETPKTVDCTACGGSAEYLSSAYQGDGTAYHNYQCRAESCPAGGAIVEHERGTADKRRVGPVFQAPRSHHRRQRDDHPAGSPVRDDHNHTREHEQPADASQEARA